MKIGELAAATGLAPSAIRFYEQSGLLPAAKRSANGYRSYSAEAVERLRYIQLAQALGFTLDTLRAGFANQQTLSQDQKQDEMLQRLDARLGEVDHMLETLRAQRKDLLAVRERLLATWATGDCLDPASVRLTPVEPAAPLPRAHRPTLSVGIGLRQGATSAQVESAVRAALGPRALEEVAAIATLDTKADHPALADFCARHGIARRAFAAADIKACLDTHPALHRSAAALAHTGVAGVCEPCALLAAKAGTLLVARQAHGGVTVAVAEC